MNRLLLCAGSHTREGWLTHDGDPKFGTDIVGMIPPLPDEVVNRKWDEVEWSHGIGTFFPWQGRQILEEFFQVLKADGTLTLIQPNARLAAHKILEDPSYVWWMHGDPILESAPHMNCWTYTPESLQNLVLDVGFSSAVFYPSPRHPERDFVLEARR